MLAVTVLLRREGDVRPIAIYVRVTLNEWRLREGDVRPIPIEARVTLGVT
jgi:hypothetical protein